MLGRGGRGWRQDRGGEAQSPVDLALAAVGVGFVLGGLAADKANDVQKAYREGTTTGVAAKEMIDEGKSLDTAAVITWIAGGAVLAAGVTMVALDLAGVARPERRAWLAPGVLPGGGALCAGLEF